MLLMMIMLYKQTIETMKDNQYTEKEANHRGTLKKKRVG